MLMSASAIFTLNPCIKRRRSASYVRSIYCLLDAEKSLIFTSPRSDHLECSVFLNVRKTSQPQDVSSAAKLMELKYTSLISCPFSSVSGGLIQRRFDQEKEIEVSRNLFSCQS